MDEEGDVRGTVAASLLSVPGCGMFPSSAGGRGYFEVDSAAACGEETGPIYCTSWSSNVGRGRICF